MFGGRTKIFFSNTEILRKRKAQKPLKLNSKLHVTQPFPDGFLGGWPTSSQQIEGGPAAGGRGESIWDRFASVPGRSRTAPCPTSTCDHSTAGAEDIEFMSWLGVGAYRFSIAWPRSCPRPGAPPSGGTRFLRAPPRRASPRRIHLPHPLPLGPAPGPAGRGGWADRETCRRVRGLH